MVLCAVWFCGFMVWFVLWFTRFRCDIVLFAIWVMVGLVYWCCIRSGLCDVVTGFWWCCWLRRLVVCVGLWFAGVDLFVLDCGTWRCRFGLSFAGLY